MFDFPAAYRRHVEANLALIGSEIGRDVSRREDEDPRVQRLATVPNELMDPTATGRVFVLVLNYDPTNCPAPADSCDHLHAFAPGT